ncbi:hypothetical protein LY90DRAFT_500374 [Neocallimastix californiae]|uniref:Uncharacterized protein n=1 Tax=Neocallimastix californiae TaxID=1754190 RepID=A0A1Y2F9P8_9FUNG|nr:hypothetical protein LY90DRAFT_500374 [Neocallimastix californiae]|eukprot:ORY80593.1 hypothetical protein LY90DRAFT_500374 [Neocallimastix californiae]
MGSNCINTGHSKDKEISTFNEDLKEKTTLPKRNKNKKKISKKKENLNNLNHSTLEKEGFPESESLTDPLPEFMQEQQINDQIHQYLNLPNYQLQKYVFEILDNENFVSLVQKINELYSSYICD